MKKYIKGIILSLTLILIFVLSLIFLGNKSETIKNVKNKIELTSKPRLEDDYYDCINYDKLSKLLIDENDYEDSWTIFEEYEDEIEDIKKNIIDEIVSKCDTYEDESNYKKICTLYNAYKNIDYEVNKKELTKYIDLINSSKNIDEYLKNISETNESFLDANILFNFGYHLDEDDELYPSIGGVYYSYADYSELYAIKNERMYSNELSYIKNTDLELLKNYGYSEEEAKSVINKIYPMFNELAKYSIDPVDDVMVATSKEELESKYKNINFDYIFDIVNKYTGEDYDEIIITDKRQFKLLDEYLVNDNLETLKDYAVIRLLYSYGKYTNDKDYELLEQLSVDLKEKEEVKSLDDFIYDEIYLNFSNTIAVEFSKKYKLEDSKEYYSKLINEIIDEYKDMINNETWLSDETKKNAIKKLDNMKIYVISPEDNIEDNYEVSGNSLFEILNKLDFSSSKTMPYYYKNHMLIILFNDWLNINAYYSSTDNSMIIESGIVYALNKYYNINNFEDSYYKVLGSLGIIIGHEISHSFDNSGSKYDENGDENDWWTSEDKINYNRLTTKVEKYYENYHQEGYQTLGENIADLGGVSVIMNLAGSKKATTENYKTIFETYALMWAEQSTKFFESMILRYETHSPSKNRTNAVLSSIDKFYEVYDIKESDKMFVKKEDRVKVW